MAYQKLSITLPDELAAQIDHIATEDGVSRSFVLQEAAARYVVARGADAREEERQASIQRAIEGFRRIQEQWGPDERSGLDYLDEIRGVTKDTDCDHKHE